MEYFPVFLKLTDQPVLIIGGGTIAARKITLLRRAGARITVYAPRLNRALQELHQAQRITWVDDNFEPESVCNYRAVIAATNDHAMNSRVAQACQSRNIPVNVVDAPALCSFITPAIVDRSPLIVAISSAGQAPVLARRLRARLETLLPATYANLARFAGNWRERVKRRLTVMEARRRFWEQALEGLPAARVLAGDERGGDIAMHQALDEFAENESIGAGEVYLVGAGPGDPDLLTFRALRLMQQAEIVLYDRLVNPALLDLVRRDAERVYVGKRSRRHTLPQEQINDMLVRLARQGRRVLRLKGGDPFVFGRGGEEIDRLAAAGIAFHIVPGITAANGCAAYAGIPLTHRDYAQACTFVTGHASRDGSLRLNWASLSQPGQTVVIYMGVSTLAEICRQLRVHGLEDSHPAALIVSGTTQTQRVISGTLESLPAKVLQAAPVGGPGLVIVGEVVKLRHKLAWFRPGRAGERAENPLQSV